MSACMRISFLHLFIWIEPQPNFPEPQESWDETRPVGLLAMHRTNPEKCNSVMAALRFEGFVMASGFAEFRWYHQRITRFDATFHGKLLSCITAEIGATVLHSLGNGQASGEPGGCRH